MDPVEGARFDPPRAQQLSGSGYWICPQVIHAATPIFSERSYYSQTKYIVPWMPYHTYVLHDFYDSKLNKLMSTGCIGSGLWNVSCLIILLHYTRMVHINIQLWLKGKCSGFNIIISITCNSSIHKWNT